MCLVTLIHLIGGDFQPLGLLSGGARTRRCLYCQIGQYPNSRSLSYPFSLSFTHRFLLFIMDAFTSQPPPPPPISAASLSFSPSLITLCQSTDLCSPHLTKTPSPNASYSHYDHIFIVWSSSEFSWRLTHYTATVHTGDNTNNGRKIRNIFKE